MALLKAENISVQFDNKPVLNDISLSLSEGELVSILGVSGSGKTTLFNVLSGLIVPDFGKVYIENVDVTGKSGHTSYMLQKDLLLPYKTIIDNVALPLVMKGMSKKEARTKVEPYFADFGLEDTMKKYPHQLSGGMRQRAALLRTYMCNNKIALLDEPFSALDTLTKTAMHNWYLGIMEQIKLSTLFITHDIDEAILLSDRIYILGGNGKITNCITIDKEHIRKKDLLLSESFLKYKKAILNAIGE